MEIISDTVDDNGMHHLVVRYTEEEKAAMAQRAEEHKAEMERLRAEHEAAHKAPKAAEAKKTSRTRRKQSA